MLKYIVQIVDISKDYAKTLSQVSFHLKEGHLVVFPSDTVYILAVDPTQITAVNRLLSFKNRWPGKAISIAVSDVKMAEKYVSLNKDTRILYQNLFPGPFTIVSPGRHLLAPGIEAENGSLGIRIPDSKYILDLLNVVKKPITATSANLSGRTPHYSISAFLNTLSQKKLDLISLIVDAGRLPKNKPSTVIDALGSDLKILRPGQLIAKNAQTFLSKSEDETGDLAVFLGKKLKSISPKKAIVFLLSGDLGCGKTVFSRALAKYLGVTKKVLSPTFIIHNSYPLSNSSFSVFHHFDLYRLNQSYEYKEINFFSYFSPTTISAIEWPENMGQDNLKKIQKNTLTIPISFSYSDQNTRQISFSWPKEI